MTTSVLNNLSKIDKEEESVTASTLEVLENSKKNILEVCKSLTAVTNEYAPGKTVELLHKYNEEIRTGRILYSEMSNYLFSLDENERANFVVNAEALLEYSYENSSIDDKYKRIILKVYDHSQLAVHQVSNASKILAAGVKITNDGLKNEFTQEIEKMREDFSVEMVTFTNDIKNVQEVVTTDIKNMQKEYITILGIFAAVILAFVGGITFSSSVLQNMKSVTIFRLLIVIDLLGLILINAIYMLMKFIFIINRHDVKDLSIWGINLFLIGIGTIILIAGFCEFGIWW